ncbi:MAG: Signal peptidase I, partial [uncultured Nocardioidaceae bacterium]
DQGLGEPRPGQRGLAARGPRPQVQARPAAPGLAGDAPAPVHRLGARDRDQGLLHAGLLHPVGLDERHLGVQRPHPGAEGVLLGRRARARRHRGVRGPGELVAADRPAHCRQPGDPGAGAVRALPDGWTPGEAGHRRRGGHRDVLRPAGPGGRQRCAAQREGLPGPRGGTVADQLQGAAGPRGAYLGPGGQPLELCRLPRAPRRPGGRHGPGRPRGRQGVLRGLAAEPRQDLGATGHLRRRRV